MLKIQQDDLFEPLQFLCSYLRLWFQYTRFKMAALVRIPFPLDITWRSHTKNFHSCFNRPLHTPHPVPPTRIAFFQCHTHKHEIYKREYHHTGSFQGQTLFPIALYEKILTPRVHFWREVFGGAKYCSGGAYRVGVIRRLA